MTIPAPAAPYWEGPITDPAVLDAQPHGTVAIDDVNRMRQRRTGDSITGGGWTSAGKEPLSSEELVQEGSRPVFLLRQCACDFPDVGHTLACRLGSEPTASAKPEPKWEYGFYDSDEPERIWWYMFGGLLGFDSVESAEHAAVKSVWGQPVIVRRIPGNSDWEVVPEADRG